MISEDTVYSDEVTINAPVEIVWKVLTDFSNYAAWNIFNPSIKTQLILGAPVEMLVDLGDGLQEQVEHISRIDINKEIAWSMELDGGDTLHACRTQTLTKLSESSCSYLSADKFRGTLRDDILKAHGPAIEKGFNNCAYGLKKFVEAL